MTKFKYKVIYRPHHPKACKAGWVYEHRYFMELQLGRYLKKGEVVHHIDGDKKNNEESNLKLFSNYKEHKEEHYGHPDKRICSLCGSNKTYIAIRKGKYKVPIWFKHKNGYMCGKCRGKYDMRKQRREKRILLEQSSSRIGGTPYKQSLGVSCD